MEILRPVSAEKEVENLRRDRPARRLRAEVSTLGGVFSYVETFLNDYGSLFLLCRFHE